MANPTYGTDATGADAYASIISAPGTSAQYNYVIVSCATNDAILSLDGGTTDHIYVVADKDPMRVDFPRKATAIHAKNATGGKAYGSLVVIAGLSE